MKKLAAAVLCSLCITATAGFSMVAEAAHGDKVNIAEPFKANCPGRWPWFSLGSPLGTGRFVVGNGTSVEIDF